MLKDVCGDARVYFDVRSQRQTLITRLIIRRLEINARTYRDTSRKGVNRHGDTEPFSVLLRSSLGETIFGGLNGGTRRVGENDMEIRCTGVFGGYSCEEKCKTSLGTSDARRKVERKNICTLQVSQSLFRSDQTRRP